MALAYLGLYWAYLFWHRENELRHWASLVAIPLPMVLALRVGKPSPLPHTLASFGLRGGNLTRGLGVTLFLGVGVGLPQVFLSRSGPAVLEAFASGRALYLLPLTFAALLLLTGFTEEFFFRGFLQTRLEPLLRSRWVGPVTASVLFGLYDVPCAYFVPQWPSAGSWSAAFATGIGEGLLGGIPDLPQQRVLDRWPRKATEVPVRGPELTDSVIQAQGRDPGVMDPGPAHSGGDQHVREMMLVPRPLLQEHEGRGLEPCCDLVQGGCHLAWGIVDPGMGHHRQELVDARPGDGPGVASFREASHRIRRPGVPFGIPAVGVDQEVGIHGDHAPCPS